MIKKLIGNTLVLEQRNELVARLHRILEVLEYEVAVEDPQLFTEVTQEAVSVFQEENSLEPSGIVTGETAELLETLYLESGFGEPHQIVGTLTDESTGAPVEKLLVQVWDSDEGGQDDLLGEVLTNAEGGFLLEFDEMTYGDKGDEEMPLPDLYFQIFDGRTLILDTKDDLQNNLPKGQHEFNFSVNLKNMREWRIVGRITGEANEPIAGLKVELWDNDQFKENPLATGNTNANGEVDITFDHTVFPEDALDYQPDLYFNILQNDNLIKSTQTTPLRKLNPGTHTLNLSVAINDDADDEATNQVKGYVFDNRRVGIGQLRVVALDKNLRSEVVLGETTTDAKGYYTITYTTADNLVGKDRPDIQINVFNQDEKLIYASPIRYDASSEERIDMLVPTDEIKEENEYQQLTTRIQAVAGDIALKDLKEDDENQDITYLANKTGIDARLVAMTALANQYSNKTGVPSPFYYAMFRAGLPTDEKGINELDNDTVANVWNKATEQNIIDPTLKDSIEDNVARYEEKSTDFLLQEAPATGVSTLSSMLDLSLENDEQKRTFVNTYLAAKGDTEQLWEKTTEQLGEATTQRLRLDGKLGLLTINNASLIQQLEVQEDPVELIPRGLYQADAWEDLLNEGIEIPSDFPGAEATEQRENYKRYMASQLKISYPTAVLADQVSREEFKLGNGDVAQQVTSFLNEQQATFDISTTPVEKYLKDNDLQVEEAVKGELKALQRTYQITPSDDAMKVLLDEGLNSAQSVVQLGEQGFMDRFTEKLGEQEAKMVFAKSHQIHSTVVNVAVGYLTYFRNPQLYVLHSEQDSPMETFSTTQSQLSDVIAYPTLEELFGEMDFCECNHCRSVLSPAAYLVDLLKFIDLTPLSSDAAAGKENPLEVLLDRRPDIQHIQLTCANTNTVLPYIDLVNEILEHFVVHANSENINIEDEDFSPLEGFEGYNLDDNITTEELLANPQFVKEEAYNVLKQQVYPLSLPFNQPLVASRHLWEHLETPLYQAMTTLRVNDDPGTWQEIHQEFLHLSKEAFAILTTNPNELAEYYGEAAGTDLDATLKANTTYARDLTRKLDITYKELTALVKTQFMNPTSRLIPKLENIFVSITNIVAFINGDLDETQFDALLPDDFDESSYDGDLKNWLQDYEDEIVSLILLVDPTSKPDDCSFVPLELRYADNAAITEVDYFKLLRFIRLWHTLGWSIEQTDKAIAALWPDFASVRTMAQLNQGFEQLLTRLAHLKKVMELLSLKPKRDLLQALALFAEIDTFGQHSLYRQLFLNTSITQLDDVFQPNALEEFLLDDNTKVWNHKEAVAAAFNLPLNDLRQLLESMVQKEASFNTIEDVPLNLVQLSMLHRHAYLSRSLKMSVEELLILIDFSQINPFDTLQEVQPSIIQFIELAQALKAAKINIPDLTYYLRHQDLSGNASPTKEEVLALTKQLKDELQRIEIENAAISDPTGEVAQTKMALLYEQEVVDQFFSLVNNTVINVTTYDHHQNSLEADFATTNTRLSYNDFRKQLSFQGIMTLAERDALTTAADVIPTDDNYRANFTTALQVLFDQGQVLVQTFFANYPELQTPYEDYLTQKDFDLLIQAMLATFKATQKKLAIQQLLVSTLGVELDLITTLLDQPAVLHALQDDKQSALADFLNLETNGVSATYVLQDNTTEEATLTSVNTNLEGQALPDTQPLQQVTNRFYVATSEPDFYKFRLNTDAGATVTFSLNGQLVAGSINNNGLWENTEAIELEANRYHAIAVQLENVTDRAVLRWAKENGSGGYRLLPTTQVYPEQAVRYFRRNYLRLLKAVALAELLEMQAEEIAFFGEKYQVNSKGFLNAIPIAFDQNAATTHQALLQIVTELLQYTTLKEQLTVEPSDFLMVLADPSVNYEDSAGNALSLLLKITDYEEENLAFLLSRFSLTQAQLTEIPNFYRLWQAYELVVQTGISAETLSTAASNDPTLATVTNLEQAIRIKYDTSAWYQVIQPINDALRNQQRDALVAYVLRLMQRNDKTKTVDTADKLFEYFLIDVQMDACMKTSRIKQAISTVQLFISRCLINLEPRASVTAINAKQWEWMKRYRVWEANRKVFLYPENWLEPELRDNKSPFFKDLESELLESDITEEAAHVALLHYLEKLDEVAKLEICGMYLDEKKILEDGAYYDKDDVLHVIGRTPGMNRKYYYRRYEGYWTPWEKIDLDIEDNPVLPVVWKGRLFLFWLNIIQKGPENKESTISKGNVNDDRLINAKLSKTPSTKITIEANLSWSEYYNGKWQPRRTSDFNKPSILGKYLEFKREDIKIGTSIGSSDQLFVNLLLGPSAEQTLFILYNKYTAIRPSVLVSRIIPIQKSRKVEVELDALAVTYTEPNATVRIDQPKETITEQKVLENAIGANVIVSRHPVKGVFIAPFFFQDGQYVFFVVPEVGTVPFSKYDDLLAIDTLNNNATDFKVNLNESRVQLLTNEEVIAVDPTVGIPLLVDPAELTIVPSELAIQFDKTSLNTSILSTNTIKFGEATIAATGSIKAITKR